MEGQINVVRAPTFVWEHVDFRPLVVLQSPEHPILAMSIRIQRKLFEKKRIHNAGRKNEENFHLLEGVSKLRKMPSSARRVHTPERLHRGT